MSADRDQFVLPVVGTQPKPTKVRVYQDGRRWAVAVPAPDGRPDVFHRPDFAAAIRYLDLVTKRRRRQH